MNKTFDYSLLLFLIFFNCTISRQEYTDAEKSLEMQNSKRNLKKIYGRPTMSKYVDLERFGGEEDDDDDQAEVVGLAKSDKLDDDNSEEKDGATVEDGDIDLAMENTEDGKDEIEVHMLSEA